MVRLTYTGGYVPVLPAGHRFPIAKYELVREQLLYEGSLGPEQLHDPGLCPDEYIIQVHDPVYWQQAKQLQLSAKDVRALGLPLVPETVLRAQNSVHCTLQSAMHALDSGLGIHLGGGTHHAYAQRPEGFCLLNDLAVAAGYLINSQKCKQVLILDLDVHQGNGTAHIFQNNPRVYTFSLHCDHNYPLRKERSDQDIALAAGMGDKEYLSILEQTLPSLLKVVQPDLVLYQAGVDVLQGDALGKLCLSKQGCQQRDAYVLQLCYQQGVPVVLTLGGGYNRSLSDLVDAHCNSVRTALSIWS